MFTLRINDTTHSVDVPPDMPLLWIIRDVAGLTGTKFGCGVAACGACTIHLGGQPIRSCVTPVSAVADKPITTIKAIGATPAGAKVQMAWLDLEVVQCGYCQSGQIMSAAALLAGLRDTGRHALVSRKELSRRHCPGAGRYPQPRVTWVKQRAALGLL
jgi:isoquinoline 1-oxidoreductase alpha subunit